MMLHHLARLEMMKAEEQGINLTYEEALNIVNKQVMANENAFKIIDVEDAIARYKLGYISDSDALALIQAVVGKQWVGRPMVNTTVNILTTYIPSTTSIGIGISVRTLSVSVG